MADDDFAGKPTADEQKALDRVYDRNAAVPLPPPTAKGAMYSWSPGAAVLDRRDAELFSDAGLGTAERQQLRSTFAEIGKIGLPDSVVAQIAEGHIDALLAATRVKTDAEAEADETVHLQQIQANNAELREQFARKYGARDGEKLLERTQRFVRSHPKLADLLKENGLGSRIEIVEAVAAHVFSNGLAR